MRQLVKAVIRVQGCHQQVVLEQCLGRLRPSGGAAQYADAAALGPAGALRGSTTLVLSGSNWRLLLLLALSIASKYMDDDHLSFIQLIKMCASHVLKSPPRTARAAPPVRLLRARLAAPAARHPLAPARVLGAYPDQRPLTIQALRQLMCPPAGAAAADRAAQGPPWAGRWRGRWRGLRERLLRLWATARAAAQELPRLRAKGRASRAPPAGGSATCGAALPGARTGSKQWLLGSSARNDDAQCAMQALVTGLVAQGATTHSRVQRAGRPQEAAPRAVRLRALTRPPMGLTREQVASVTRARLEAAESALLQLHRRRVTQ